MHPNKAGGHDQSSRKHTSAHTSLWKCVYVCARGSRKLKDDRKCVKRYVLSMKMRNCCMSWAKMKDYCLVPPLVVSYSSHECGNDVSLYRLYATSCPHWISSNPHDSVTRVALLYFAEETNNGR